jgi:phosphoglycerate kinase
MTSALHSINLFEKTIFLRADLNVPLSSTGNIIDDFRLKALQPTLNLLVTQQSRIILGTHIGRPQGYEELLSTKHLVSWFRNKGYNITWVPTLEEAQQKAHSLKPGMILLLENLRFNPGEKGKSHQYAKELSQLAQFYVNDAWGVLENEDASITLLPELFAKEDKTIGLLVEHEIKMLRLLRPPERPFVILMGGAKLQEKLPFVSQALKFADNIILLPPLAFTFMKAQGLEVGDSLIHEELLPIAHKILTSSSRSRGKLLLPTDFLVESKNLSGKLSITVKIGEGQLGIAMGPESLKRCAELIGSAKSIFINGAMGFIERPETLEPFRKLLQSIVQGNTISIIGGGESLAAVKLFGLEQSFTFCSTGGGTTLRYILTGSLPALTYIS